MIITTDKPIDIEFEVIQILSRNKESRFTVAKIKLLDYQLDKQLLSSFQVAIGCFENINIGDEFEGSGVWINNKVYGHQFKIENTKMLIPKDDKKMIDFIRKYVKGIGYITARKIVNKFGINTLDVILNHPDKIIEIGITEKKVNDLHDAMLEYGDFNRFLNKLQPLGLSVSDITLIYKKIDKLSVDKIMRNPYILCDICSIDFKKVDDIAKKLGFKANSPYRIRSGIMLYISKQIETKGDIYTLEEKILKNLSEFLKEYGKFNTSKLILNDIKKELKELVSLKQIVITENHKKQKCVYIKFYEYIENEVVEKITNRLKTNKTANYSKEKTDKIIDENEQTDEIKLDIKQKKAVYMAINNNVSIISGGPGTGKSQTINTIIDCIKKLDSKLTIELCAPTGRAAKRITELTNVKAKTIHRLIGLNNFNQDNLELIPVSSDYLIIDEASMVDIYMFYSLLTVLSVDTKLIIVGDHQQLPSVGPGLILKDFMNSGFVPKTILTKIFRQAMNSQIIMNSYEIIKGSNKISLDNDKKDFYFLNQTNLSEISNLILASIERLLDTGFMIGDIQVISPLNSGRLGTIEINKRIQQKFNGKYSGVVEIEIEKNEYVRINDRVMQTVNNYELDVFNGEIGIVVGINKGIISDDNFELIVDFSDKLVSYNYSNIKELFLAYAITVHKSQGSEFPVVIMPFHSTLSFLNNRSIIYTTWTRAKDRVICIGDRSELNLGIQRNDNLVRNSMIIEKMKEKNRKNNNDNIIYAYMAFKENKIEQLIDVLKKDIDEIEKILKRIAVEHGIEEVKYNDSKFIKLEEALQETEQKVLQEYKNKIDELRKLNGLLNFIKDKYHDFNPRDSYKIPFGISKKGHGILKKIQMPKNNLKYILGLIDLEPIERELKSYGFNKNDNLDMVIICYNLKGIELEMLKTIINKLQSWSLPYLYIGNKLYVLREDASRNNEFYDINQSGRTKQLAIIRLIKEKLDNLLFGFAIEDKVVLEIR